jgi:ATP adenylyltransferase
VPLYNPSNHRSAEQLEEMERLSALGRCLFCELGGDDDGGATIYQRGDWVVRHNQFPYEGARIHLLLVPTIHVDDLLSLPKKVLEDMWPVLDWVHASMNLQHYGLAVRCGDCNFTGGTIEHVHVHLIVGDVQSPDHEPIRFKLSSRPE